jgi:hypothetical protein
LQCSSSGYVLEILTTFTLLAHQNDLLEEISMTDTYLHEIAAAIKAGDTSRARELLRIELRVRPSANAWYLAARIASSPEQTISFLEKAIELDPFHEHANRFLTYTRRRQSRPTSPANSPPSTSPLLRQAVTIFGNNAWEVKFSTPEVVQFEKKNGVNTGCAVLLILLVGLLGSLIVVLAIASAKTERVTFTANADGSLSGVTSKGQFLYRTTDQLTARARSVKTGTTSYAGAIALGLISTFCYLILMGY